MLRALVGKNILVSGSHGLIGSALLPLLSESAACPVPLLRMAGPVESHPAACWDPEKKVINVGGLDRLDAAVHLAGESIAGRWSRAKKEKIRRSRVESTRFLAQTLARLSHPPQCLLCASAVGYYGDRRSETVNEKSPPGSGGFLSEVCREWEAAAQPAKECGIRVVHMRFGMVLSKSGGALAAMLPIFRAGLGGRVGSGDQMISWVALDDALRAICFLIGSEDIEGPVNLTSPNAVTNREFAEELAAALRRPALLPVPAAVARWALGDLADEVLLSSVRAAPEVLLHSGFAFQFSRLNDFLKKTL